MTVDAVWQHSGSIQSHLLECRYDIRTDGHAASALQTIHDIVVLQGASPRQVCLSVYLHATVNIHTYIPSTHTTSPMIPSSPRRELTLSLLYNTWLGNVKRGCHRFYFDDQSFNRPTYDRQMSYSIIILLFYYERRHYVILQKML